MTHSTNDCAGKHKAVQTELHGFQGTKFTQHLLCPQELVFFTGPFQTGPERGSGGTSAAPGNAFFFLLGTWQLPKAASAGSCPGDHRPLRDAKGPTDPQDEAKGPTNFLLTQTTANPLFQAGKLRHSLKQGGKNSRSDWGRPRLFSWDPPPAMRPCCSHQCLDLQQRCWGLAAPSPS